MSNILAYGGRLIGGGGNSQSGGHIIVNSAGTELAQEDKLKFTGSLKASDDSTNGQTVIDDSPTQLTFEQWIALTPEQQAAIPKALITGAPGIDGNLSTDLMTILWENPNPTVAFASQTITLSSSDYDMLLITYRSVTNHAYDFSCVINKGCNAILSVASSTGSAPWNIIRFMGRNSDTSYILGDAQHVQPSGSVVENNCAVPLVIYGIKKTINIEFSAIASDVSTSADKCIMPDGVTSASVAISNLYQYGLNYRDVTNDCDTAVNVGFYAINTDAANVPSSEFIHGVLVTLGGFSTYQIAISGTNKIAVRYAVGTTWRII